MGVLGEFSNFLLMNGRVGNQADDRREDQDRNSAEHLWAADR